MLAGAEDRHALPAPMTRAIDVRTDAEKEAQRRLWDIRCLMCGSNRATFALRPGTMRCADCRVNYKVHLNVTFVAGLRDDYLQSIAKKRRALTIC